MPWEGKDKEWWHRVRPPGKYKRFFSKQITEGIRAIIGVYTKNGKKVSEIQALRFSKSKFKTLAEAKSYMKKHPQLKA